MKPSYSRYLNLILLLGLVASLALPVQPARAAAPIGDLTDPQDLAAFFAGAMSQALVSHNIPGGLVAVVHDGTLQFSGGYGVSNLEQRTPVDPARTLFRPGSVSKLFTWTAVMQLVEQGKLDLDTDINTYLDFQITPAFDQPITLRHLMTHTPGFEDRGELLFHLKAETLPGLEGYVKRAQPQRVFPPGEIPAYSNYGTALAGYIIQRVSGEAFEDYIERHIFQPLGMGHSTFRQPLPPALAGDMAQGYLFSNGGYQTGSFEFVGGAPAGALSSTAEDMARFMLAHLANGAYDGGRILQAETAQLMHTQAHTFDPRTTGMTLGWIEMNVLGERLITHGGDTLLFHSLLALLPEHDTGIFLSFNAADGGTARNQILHAFIERYIGGTERPLPALGASDATLYTGAYTMSRQNFSGFEKVLSLMQPVSLQALADGALLVSTPFGPARYREVEPGVLQSEITSDRLFLVERNGRRYGALENVTVMVVWLLPPLENSSLHLFLVALGMVMALGALVAAVGRGLRWLRRREVSPLLPRLARWTAALYSLAVLVYTLLMLTMIGDIVPGFGVPRLFFDTPPQMAVLLVVGVLIQLLLLPLLVFSLLAWLRRLDGPWWTGWARLRYTLLALSGLGMVLALRFYNVL